MADFFTYQFERTDNIDPSVSSEVSDTVQTEVRGQNPSFDAIMSGVESFVLAAGFPLNGSGIGPVAK
jgi:hypothetical protein